MWHSRHLLVLLAALLSTFVAARARAHEVGLSRGEYAVSGNEVTASVTFSGRDVRLADGPALAKELSVRGDGAACPIEILSAFELETDGVRFVLRATCPQRPSEVTIDALFLRSLPFGHRHLARPAGAAEVALTVSRSTLTFASSSDRSAPARGVYLTLGLRHILTGVDHLVFLLGLMLIGGAARQLVVVVTAFTIGHSVSLGLATFGLLVPSARVVEPMIAASIIYVGVENLFQPSPATRWRLTLPFGLLHGFGFAHALRQLALPRAELPMALALFNVGVEVGQLAVLAAVVPFIFWARRREWFRARGVWWLSLGIAIVGFGWFAARVLTG